MLSLINNLDVVEQNLALGVCQGEDRSTTDANQSDRRSCYTYQSIEQVLRKKLKEFWN